MSIKVEVSSPDLDKQIRLLQQSDKFLDRYFAQHMQKSVDLTYDLIYPNIPRGSSGLAAREFSKGIFGFGRTLTGAVGWFSGTRAWYINIVEHGANKHSLLPTKGRSQKQRQRRAARLEKQLERGKGIKGVHVLMNGQWVTVSVHPGFGGSHFMKQGFEAAKPRVEEEMKKGADAALNAMAVK